MTDATTAAHEGQRLHVPTAMRFGDLDAYGHLNNVATLRLLEEARVQAFWLGDPEHDGVYAGPFASTAVLDSKPGAGTLTILAHQEIEYLQSVPYMRSPLDIQVWFGRIGGASIELCYEIHSPLTARQHTLYTRAMTTLVLVDASTQRPRRLSDVEREAWEPYLGEPIAFRRGSGASR